jgi:hypothetical protein
MRQSLEEIGEDMRYRWVILAVSTVILAVDNGSINQRPIGLFRSDGGV